MADITQITTHVADAKARLLEQYKSLPNINALVEIFSGRYQDLEDILSDFVSGRSLFTAIGTQLDNMGKIINLARVSGQSDADYRAALFVQISINTAQGDPRSVTVLVQNLTGANIVRYRNLGNGVMSFEIDVTPPGDIAELYERIEKGTLAGVRVDSITTITSASSFSFAGNDGVTESLGFGDLNNAAVGGVWSEILTF